MATAGKRVYKRKTGAPGAARRQGNKIARAVKSQLPGVTHVAKAARNLVRNDFAPKTKKQAAVMGAYRGINNPHPVPPTYPPGRIGIPRGERPIHVQPVPYTGGVIGMPGGVPGPTRNRKR